MVAALLSTRTSALTHPPAIAVIAAGRPSQGLRTRATQTIDTSPPGQLRSAKPTPLRV